MFKLRVVLAFMSLICAFALPADSSMTSAGTIDLKVGEFVIIGEGIQIGFDGVPADSRCPQDAFCFWEGDAVALMWADDPSTEKVRAELHTHRGFQWQFTFGEYRITLVGVAPYPKMGERIDPMDYVATIIVAHVSTPVEQTSWGRIKAIYERQ